MVEVGAGPLDMPHVAHLFPGDAVEQRTQFTHLIPDLLIVFIVHGIAHFTGEQADNFPVSLHVASGVNGLFETLEAAIGAGEYAAVLAPGGGG